MYFDATGSLVRPIPWLRNHKNNPKRILLYSLVIVHPDGKVPPIASFDYITSEHHIFSVRKPFLRLKEMEQKIYGSGNGVSPNLILTDYSAAIIQLVVQEMTGNDLVTCLQKAYNMVQKIDETRQIGTVFCICSFPFLKLNREKMKKHYNKKEDNVKVHFSQRILGRLICCSSLKDAVNIVKALACVAVSRTNKKNVEVSLKYLEEFQEIDELIEQSEEGDVRFEEMEEFQHCMDWDMFWKEKL